MTSYLIFGALCVALIQAERWNGQLPTTMVPGATVPFMDVNPVKTP